MRDWFSAKTYAETVAWSKIIVDQTTDRILGAHFVGHAGQELVNLFGLAMRFGLTAAQIRDNVYAYPTFSSDIKHMLGGQARIAMRYQLQSYPAFPSSTRFDEGRVVAGPDHSGPKATQRSKTTQKAETKEIITCSSPARFRIPYGTVLHSPESL